MSDPSLAGGTTGLIVMTPTQLFLQARDFLLGHRDDYDFVYREFRWPQLEHFNWALDFFDVEARGNQTPALWLVEEDGSESKLTYEELSARSNQAANYLRSLGVKRGDRVLLMLPNCVPLWECQLAVIKLGAVFAPATLLLTPAELRDRIERGRIRHVVVDASEASKFTDLPRETTRIAVGDPLRGWHHYEEARGFPLEFQPDGLTHADDPQILYFTSGTTARPKRVLHSQQSYAVGHLVTMYFLGLGPGDLHWNISSPGWGKHAYSSFFAPLNAGATVFACNYSRFSAARALEILCRYGVTSLCAPPTVWRMLVQEDLAAYPVRLRNLLSAGEPLNPEVLEQVRCAWARDIREGYGQTETTIVIGSPPGRPVKPGSMGRAMPGYRVALLDPEGRPADEGEVALELSPRPVGLMLGYEEDAAKSAEAFRGGYYHTNDVATRDAEGYYYFVGRADDVFKVSDYRISPFELESVLIEHEAIVEAAVVPSPDPRRLAVPKAFITLAPGKTPSRELAAAIFEFCRARLAPFRRIRRIEFCELPKTFSGKIRRVELRKLEEARDLGERRPFEFWEQDF